MALKYLDKAVAHNSQLLRRILHITFLHLVPFGTLFSWQTLLLVHKKWNNLSNYHMMTIYSRLKYLQSIECDSSETIRYKYRFNGSSPIILFHSMGASNEFTWTDISVTAFVLRCFPSTFLASMFCKLCFCSIRCLSSSAASFRAFRPF